MKPKWNCFAYMAGFKLGSMGHWKVSKDKRAILTNHWLGKENPPNCLHGKNLGMTSAKEADVYIYIFIYLFIYLYLYIYIYIMSYTCHIKKHIKTIVKPMDFGDVSYFVEAWHCLARRCWLGAAADFRCWAGDRGKVTKGSPVGWFICTVRGALAKLV